MSQRSSSKKKVWREQEDVFRNEGEDEVDVFQNEEGDPMRKRSTLSKRTTSSARRTRQVDRFHDEDDLLLIFEFVL